MTQSSIGYLRLQSTQGTMRSQITHIYNAKSLKRTMDETWDAIVIGSGMGGLAAAGLLARAGKRKVLVLEKHSERGGQTHVFRRDGAAWDVGLHYIGNLQAGTLERSLFDFLSAGALDWNRMTDDFERFVYPDFAFSVPSDPKRYEERLVARFPGEADAIRGYFRDIRSVMRWHTRSCQRQMVPRPLAFLIGQIQRFGAAKASQTTAEYLERNFRSEELRALLVSQWMDYGLPPKQSAFALHAIVVASYFNGGWFPVGGAGRVARTVEAGIEAAGGTIRICQEAKEILVENGRAVGVRAIDRRGAEPREVCYRAPVVISAVGAQLTYERLLPRVGDIGRRTEPQRAALATLKGGMSAVTLYIRLAAPVSTLGVKGENHWINTTLDHDDLDAHTARTLDGDPRHAYLSFPSAKSGDDRFHTAQVMTMVRPEAFDAWRGTTLGHRGQDYADLKERISQGLLRIAERSVPGLRALVTYAELSTPLSIEHYTSHPAGRFYCLPGTPERYRSTALGVRTPVDGLYLAGSDAAVLGVTGALMGGLAAASQVLGPAGLFRIMTAVHSPPKPATADAAAYPTEKRRAIVVAKTALTASIWRLEFELDRALAFVPGQYVKLRVAPFEWRDYSIAASTGRRLTLLISNRTRGDGSNWADTVKIGEATEIEGPLGAFRLERNDHRKVFVATGTGLAPFLSMFKAMAATGELENAELLFGCRTPDGNISAAFVDKPRRTVACVTGAAPPPGGYAGRVTKAIAGLTFDPTKTDFYLCGSAAMVADCRDLLTRAGAVRILMEPY
jgi:all-trans-retinol 13,14-reductase